MGSAARLAPRENPARRLAIFLATSGHSGVDRIMGMLIPEIASRGIGVDLLQIENHGPFLKTVPTGVRTVPLGCAHVTNALPALVRYLRASRPFALLTDKDRVNRTAILARGLARVPTRLAVRIGTSVSVNLARRGALDRTLQRLSMHFLYPRADAILVPSQGAAEDLARTAGLPLEAITVVPSPIVNADFASRTATPADHPWLQDKTVPVIIGVGELCARKDFSTLVRAFALLRKERPLRLLILGEGKKRSEITQLAQDLGVAEDVALAGFVPNPLAYMARSTLYVHSSRCEGLPVALVEALAAGLPVVSTDCPSGPKEILERGRFGPLVPVGDPERMAEAMRETLAHPLAGATLKTAAAPFTVAESANHYLAALGWEEYGR